MKANVASVRREEIELFFYEEDSEFKLFIPITIDEAERLGRMLVEARAVAAKADE